MENYGIIYGVENMLDHKIYIGQTTRELRFRLYEHRSNKRTFVDQKIHEYGWENFVAVVLEECYSREELNESERRWIERLNCRYPNGYNLTTGGTSGSKHSEKTLEQMSLVKIGNTYGLGYKFPQSVIEERTKKLKNRPPETYFKVSAKRKIHRFYPNLEAEIEKNNLTYRGLARLLGMNEDTLHSKLIGKVKIKPELKLAIKEILQTDLTIEELFKPKD